MCRTTYIPTNAGGNGGGSIVITADSVGVGAVGGITANGSNGQTVTGTRYLGTAAVAVAAVAG